LRHYGFHVSKLGGIRFTSKSSVFSVIGGLIAEILFMLYFTYVTVKQVKHN